MCQEDTPELKRTGSSTKLKPNQETLYRTVTPTISKKNIKLDVSEPVLILALDSRGDASLAGNLKVSKLPIRSIVVVPATNDDFCSGFLLCKGFVMIGQVEFAPAGNRFVLFDRTVDGATSSGREIEWELPSQLESVSKHGKPLLLETKCVKLLKPDIFVMPEDDQNSDMYMYWALRCAILICNVLKSREHIKSVTTELSTSIKVHAAVQIVCKATGGSALCKVEQLKLTNTQDNSKLTQVNAVIGAVNKMQNISNHFLMAAALCVNFPDELPKISTLQRVSMSTAPETSSNRSLVQLESNGHLVALEDIPTGESVNCVLPFVLVTPSEMAPSFCLSEPRQSATFWGLGSLERVFVRVPPQISPILFGRSKKSKKFDEEERPVDLRMKMLNEGEATIQATRFITKGEFLTVDVGRTEKLEDLNYFPMSAHLSCEDSHLKLLSQDKISKCDLTLTGTILQSCKHVYDEAANLALLEDNGGPCLVLPIEKLPPIFMNGLIDVVAQFNALWNKDHDFSLVTQNCQLSLRDPESGLYPESGSDNSEDTNQLLPIIYGPLILGDFNKDSFEKSQDELRMILESNLAGICGNNNVLTFIFPLVAGTQHIVHERMEGFPKGDFESIITYFSEQVNFDKLAKTLLKVDEIDAGLFRPVSPSEGICFKSETPSCIASLAEDYKNIRLLMFNVLVSRSDPKSNEPEWWPKVAGLVNPKLFNPRLKSLSLRNLIFRDGLETFQKLKDVIVAQDKKYDYAAGDANGVYCNYYY